MNFITQKTKTKKKSTKGKKNWKKIDVTDMEKKDQVHKQEQLLEKNFANMNDSDLFQIETAPIKSLKEKLLQQKTQRKKEKKVSKTEERFIKRKLHNEQFNKNNNDKSKQNSSLINKSVEKDKAYLMWSNDNNDNSNSKIKYPTLNNNSQTTYPKIPIPHPGQSYNPSKNDLSNLLHKVVALNKRPENLQKIEENLIKEELIVQKFDNDNNSEIEENNDADNNVFKVSNNPPVDDYNQRKPKKEKNRLIRKRLYQVKEKEIIKKKENRIKLASEKGLKRLEKERKINESMLHKQKEEVGRKKKEKELLLKSGIIEE
jgi:hypothetical protein